MLLSIVESDNYRNSKNWQNTLPKVSIKPNGVEVIGPVKGPNVAIMRNRGAGVAAGEWLFFKDADCWVNEVALINLCRSLSHSGVKEKIISGVYKNQQPLFLSRAYGFIQRIWVLSGIVGKKTKTGFPAKKLLGGALLVDTKTFRSLGGFSEKVGWGGEELEFTNRARALGISTTVTYKIVIQHQNKMNFFGFFKRAWFQNYNPQVIGFDQQRTAKGMGLYFHSPVMYWIPIFAFFCVASLANGTGFVVRKLGPLWKY